MASNECTANAITAMRSHRKFEIAVTHIRQLRIIIWLAIVLIKLAARLLNASVVVEKKETI
jgi:hypothetical protein